MGRLRGLSLVFIIFIFVVTCTTVAHAQGNYTIKIGENATFTSCNYDETFFLPGSNPDTAPMPSSKEAIVTGNTATSRVTSPAGYDATAIARIGIAYDWDMNGMSWVAVKDIPVRVTFDITYTISTNYGQNGSGNVGIFAPGFQAPNNTIVPGEDSIDWMGNKSVPPGSGIIDSGTITQHVVISFTNQYDGTPLTVGDMVDPLTIEALSQAQAMAGNGDTYESNAVATVNSIKVEFLAPVPSSSSLNTSNPSTPAYTSGTYTVTVGKSITFTEPNVHTIEFSDDPNNVLPHPDNYLVYCSGNNAISSMTCTPGHAGIISTILGVRYNWDLGGRTWDEVKDTPVNVTVDLSYDDDAEYVDGAGSANSGILIDYLLFPGANGSDTSDPASWVDHVGYEARTTGRHSGNFTMTFNRTMDGRPLTVETLGDYINVYMQIQAHVPAGLASTHKASANVTLNRITIDFANTNTLLSDIAPVAAAVGIGVATAASVNILGVLYSRLIEFFFEGGKEVGKEIVNFWEVRTRHIRARAKYPIIWGVSFREIMVGLVGAFLFGTAFLYASRSPFSAENILLYVFMAGLTLVFHESAHIYFAYRYKLKTEYRFWGLGTLSMFLTSWLFLTVFAQPSRTIINEEGHSGAANHTDEAGKKIEDKLATRNIGMMALAGPIASLALFIVFLIILLVMRQDEFIKNVAELGLTMNMVLCVYNLIPFKPMEGAEVIKWNKMLWGVLFCSIPIAYVLILVGLIYYHVM